MSTRPGTSQPGSFNKGTVIMDRGYLEAVIKEIDKCLLRQRDAVNIVYQAQNQLDNAMKMADEANDKLAALQA